MDINYIEPVKKEEGIIFDSKIISRNFIIENSRSKRRKAFTHPYKVLIQYLQQLWDSFQNSYLPKKGFNSY